jgi:hypothetical protein
MQLNNEENTTANELDDIIVKILLPVTNSLLVKIKEIKEKKLEFKKEYNEIKHRKQELILKKKRLAKQRAIHEKNLNGDLSNNKLCEELLINYINFVDKKETDFIKSREDFYEMKLRKKNLEFNQALIDLIKENTDLESRKTIETKHSFESIKKLNKSSHSMPKNAKTINQSFSIDESEKKSIKKTITTVTPYKNGLNYKQKMDKKKKYYMRNKSSENLKSNSKNKLSLSKEIEHLINNYASKNKEVKKSNSLSYDNLNEGLIQMKKINKETKEIEKELKEMMNNLTTHENE